MSLGFPKRIDVDEYNYKISKRIDRINWGITFTNTNSFSSDIDEDDLFRHMERLSGKDKIDRLTINYDSNQRSAKIVKLFPNLQSLFIHGRRISSLDGIETFKGNIIVIETGDDRKRDIKSLSQAQAKRLIIPYEQPEDLCVIGKCLTLESITIYKCPSIDFHIWSSLQVTHLQFSSGNFVELGDLAHIKTLYHLMIGDCRKFERFTGDNSCVEHLIVDGCKRFDVRSISELQKIRHVTILGSAINIALSEFPQHSTIQTLALWGSCKAVIDTYDIKSKMPMLEELSIKTKASKEEKLQLTKANPTIKITFL